MLDMLPVSRAPLGINGLALTTLAVVPLLLLSIGLVRIKKAYRWHKILQTGLGILVGLALLVFEYQVRTEGWRIYAQDSAYYDTWVMPALIVHLLFAVSTLFLWSLLIFHSWKNFHKPTRPSSYSVVHKKLGRIAVLTMLGTIGTGWLFYWLAFVE